MPNLLVTLRRTGNLLHRHAFVAVRATTSVVVGLVSRPHRRRIAHLAAELGFQEGPAPILPRVSLESVTRATTDVQLHALDFTYGNVSLLELLVLARLVRERSPRGIFEIGTFDGRTTLNLAANAPADATILTLDLPPGVPTAYALAPAEKSLVHKPASGARLHGTPFASRVQQLYGDSATFDFAPFTADLVFIDGSHAYEYVRSDSLRALALLPEGRGLVVWHDYGAWEGVTRALHDLRREDPRFAELRWVEGTTLVLLERQG